MKTIASWQLPIKTASEANSSEHWTKKAKRHRLQKQWIKAAFLKERPQIAIPCAIVLVRIAPRKLDVHENLPMSFKYITDAICEYIYPGLKPGQADGKGGISFEFRQEKGKPREYAVRIEIMSD